MRYFIDCEFDNRGRGEPITLISIGVVTDKGSEFYCENSEVPLDTLTPWMQEHVVPHLLRSQPAWTWDENARLHIMRPAHIANQLRDFIQFTSDGTAPEFWGYYCHFDFVLVQQLFGDFAHWPDGWPMYCNDLRAWLDMRGYDDVKQPDDARHDALADARWIAQTFRLLWAEVGM